MRLRDVTAVTWTIVVLLTTMVVILVSVASVDAKDRQRRTRLVVMSERGDTLVNVVGWQCRLTATDARIRLAGGREADFALAVYGIAYCVKAR